MSRTQRLAAYGATSALVLGGLAALAPSASADPVNGTTSTATVTCANGTTYEVTAPERSAQFSAAHDLDSTATLVPVAWGTAHIELHSTEDGSLIDAFDEQWGGTKGGAAHQPGLQECTVGITGTEDIPELGTVVVTVSIPVTLAVTPR